MRRLALSLLPALLALIPVLAAGCGASEGRARVPVAAPRVLVLHDPAAVEAREETLHALRYAKMPYVLHDVGLSLPELDAYGAVAIATEAVHRLGEADAAALDAWVREGGALAVLYRGDHPALRDAFGFTPDAAPAGSAIPYREGTEESIVFTAPLLAGVEGLRTPASALSSLDVRPAAGALVLARTETGQPVAWRHRHGAGRVVYWNTTALTSRVYRGFVTQSLAAAARRAVRPVANWAMIHLDDFPNSASNDHLEPIAGEFGLSVADFYAHVWWPDMRALAERFGIPYSATLIFNYNGRTEPPFSFHEWLNARIEVGRRPTLYSPWASREVLRVGDELALHGYNHQSLTLEGWGSRETMVRALRAAARRWAQDGLGPLPTTYVPPMNVFDSVGVAALAEGMPSVDLISGLYVGDPALGQAREFGPEPWRPSLYHLPRATAGFLPTDFQKILQLSVLNMVGGWGHFVHPDDVLPNLHRIQSLQEAGVDVPETGFRWHGDPEGDGLFYAFTDWLAFTRAHYPWLRYLTARDALAAHRAFDALAVGWEEAEERVTIHLSAAPATFVVHSAEGERLAALDGGRLLHHAANVLFSYYVIEAERPTVTLRLAAPARS